MSGRTLGSEGRSHSKKDLKSHWYPVSQQVEYCRMLLADVFALNKKVTVERRSVVAQRRERREENSLDYSSGSTQGIYCTADQENHHSRMELGVGEKPE